MIPRALRADPKAVFAKKPSIIRVSWATARVAATEAQGGIAIVVSKKTAKNAVDRHRAKRRVAAMLLETRKSGYEVVVTLAPQAIGARGTVLKAWCTELWERILEGTHA